MLLLAASFVALAMGPILLATIDARRAHAWALDAADSFALVGILGIAVFHVVPEALAAAGGWAAIAIVAGAVLPAILERSATKTASARGTALLALSGLALHGFVDGLALAQDQARALGVALVLHRVPEGIAAWTILRASWGSRRTLAALGGLCAATSAGLVAGRVGMPAALGAPTAVVQALAIGAVLHVVVHHAPRSGAWKHHHEHARTSRPPPAELSEGDRPSAGPRHGGLRVAAGLGGVAAVVAVALLPLDPMDGGDLARATFTRLARESAPWLLAACVASGVLPRIAPGKLEGVLASDGRAVSVARAIAVASLGPVCSCGVRPLYERAVRLRAGGRAALAVLVSAAGLGPTAILVGIGLLGWRLSAARATATLAIALIAGAGATNHRPRPRGGEPLAPRSGLRGAISMRRVATTVLESVEHDGAWTILGLSVSAVVTPLVGPIASVPTAAVVIALVIVGIPGYIGAAAATLFAAAIMERGVSPGAALAFLVSAPCANIDTLRVIARDHGPRASAWFVLSVAAVSALAGWTFDAFAPATREPIVLPNAVYLVSVIAALALLSVSLVRTGPRHLLSQLVSQVARDY